MSPGVHREAFTCHPRKRGLPSDACHPAEVPERTVGTLLKPWSCTPTCLFRCCSPVASNCSSGRRARKPCVHSCVMMPSTVKQEARRRPDPIAPSSAREVPATVRRRPWLLATGRDGGRLVYADYSLTPSGHHPRVDRVDQAVAGRTGRPASQLEQSTSPAHAVRSGSLSSRSVHSHCLFGRRSPQRYLHARLPAFRRLEDRSRSRLARSACIAARWRAGST